MNIKVSPEQADFIYKAVKAKRSSVLNDSFSEPDDFKTQNPASKHLVDYCDHTFDIFSHSLFQSINKILNPKK
jgi:hypothetical protein